MFEVYTYFGRIISRHKIEGLHHAALEAARKSIVKYKIETGKPAWGRLK